MEIKDIAEALLDGEIKNQGSDEDNFSDLQTLLEGLGKNGEEIDKALNSGRE